MAQIPYPFLNAEVNLSSCLISFTPNLTVHPLSLPRIQRTILISHLLLTFDVNIIGMLSPQRHSFLLFTLSDRPNLCTVRFMLFLDEPAVNDYTPGCILYCLLVCRSLLYFISVLPLQINQSSLQG